MKYGIMRSPYVYLYSGMFYKKNKVILSKIGNVLLLWAKLFFNLLGFYPNNLTAWWKKPVGFANWC